MADSPKHDMERLDTLLALREVGNLSLEEQAELDELLDGVPDADRYDDLAGRLMVMLDSESGDQGSLPTALAGSIVSQGRDSIRSRGDGGVIQTHSPHTPKRSWFAATGWAAAAIVTIGAGIAIVMVSSKLDQEREAMADARLQIAENSQILDAARASEASMQSELTETEQRLSEAELALADERGERLELATRLAEASAALDDAQLRIAKLEAPIEPAEIREGRRLLLDVPGTVRFAWQPFDLPDNPAEQQTVTGDVVWNNELEQGYLRFVGLAQNDPAVEQYQVWVIDERGLEQKVSGGVFNADAAGEIIVPIDPAINVGQVALFAVTVEEPGGTWVPDLTRRVVVAQPAG